MEIAARPRTQKVSIEWRTDQRGVGFSLRARFTRKMERAFARLQSGIDAMSSDFASEEWTKSEIHTLLTFSYLLGLSIYVFNFKSSHNEYDDSSNSIGLERRQFADSTINILSFLQNIGDLDVRIELLRNLIKQLKALENLAALKTHAARKEHIKRRELELGKIIAEARAIPGIDDSLGDPERSIAMMKEHFRAERSDSKRRNLDRRLRKVRERLLAERLRT